MDNLPHEDKTWKRINHIASSWEKYQPVFLQIWPVYSFDFFSDNFNLCFCIFVWYSQNLFFSYKLDCFIVMSVSCFVSCFLPRHWTDYSPTYVTCWSRVGHVSQWMFFTVRVVVFALRACFFVVCNPKCFCCVFPNHCVSPLNTWSIRWIICLNSQNSNRVPRVPPLYNFFASNSFWLKSNFEIFDLILFCSLTSEKRRRKCRK